MIQTVENLAVVLSTFTLKFYWILLREIMEYAQNDFTNLASAIIFIYAVLFTDQKQSFL